MVHGEDLSIVVESKNLRVADLEKRQSRKSVLERHKKGIKNVEENEP